MIPFWAGLAAFAAGAAGGGCVVFIFLRRARCLCGHGLSSHDPQALSCAAQSRMTFQGRDAMAACACRHYVGPPLPRGWIGPALSRRLEQEQAGD